MKILYSVIILTVLVISLIVGRVMLSQQVVELDVKLESKTQAPHFSLTDLQGVERHSSEWVNKIIIVNFWASWCPPCIREIPGFIRLQEKYADQVQFVGIALDQRAPVSDFVEHVKINYPILLAERDGLDLSRSYGNRHGGLPFTAVVNRDGVIVMQHIGELSENRLDALIQQLGARESSSRIKKLTL